MAETLELQQVKCPSCRRVITSFNPFLAEVECPYCHNKAFNPLITSKKVPIPERLIAFQTQESDFEKSMITHLVEGQYVPADIFQCIGTGKVVKAYLPMFLYEGKYEASWSAKVAYNAEETRIENGKPVNRTVTGYTPQNGTARGNFAFLCLAYDGTDIPEELRSFANRFPYKASASREYDPTLLKGDNLTTLAVDADPDVVWSREGEKTINAYARDSALGQLSGEAYQNFRCTASYELKHAGRYVLAPFWFVYYTYNREQHYFLMDGLGEFTAMSAPVDRKEERYVKRKKRGRKFFFWLWLPIVIGYFLGLETDVAIGLFVLWAIIALLIYLITSIQIHRRLKASQKARQEGAKAISEK